MFYQVSRFFWIVALSVCMLACQGPREVGTKGRPFKIYFVPSIDAEKLSFVGKSMAGHLSKTISQKLYGKDEGFYVEISVPSSYIAVVEAFGTGRADFSAFNVFSYILARDIKKYPIEAVFTLHRGGGAYYQSQIVTHVDSNINSLKDLNGKKFAFSDPSSTSGYIIPKGILDRAGIKLGETVFAYRHDSVISMVYSKQVDAGSTYYTRPVKEMKNGKETLRYLDARVRVKTQYPDVFEKVKIVKLSEKIPNEPWVIRTNLYKDPAKNQKMKQVITESVLEYSKTPEGKKALKDVYDFEKLVPLSDSSYDEIRKIILSSQMDLEKQLKSKGKKKRKKKTKAKAAAEPPSDSDKKASKK